MVEWRPTSRERKEESRGRDTAVLENQIFFGVFSFLHLCRDIRSPAGGVPFFVRLRGESFALILNFFPSFCLIARRSVTRSIQMVFGVPLTLCEGVSRLNHVRSLKLRGELVQKRFQEFSIGRKIQKKKNPFQKHRHRLSEHHQKNRKHAWSNLPHIRKIIHMVTHGYEQIKEQFAAALHLQLHGAATFEGAAAADDES